MRGFFQDANGDRSSKRLESVISLCAAILIAGASIAFAWGKEIASGLVITFLTYSAAMQGISMVGERSASANGTNGGVPRS